MRTAPKGAALWTSAGAFAPDPTMLRIALSPAGGTGGWAAAWANMATVFIPCAIDSFFVQNNL